MAVVIVGRENARDGHSRLHEQHGAKLCGEMVSENKMGSVIALRAGWFVPFYEGSARGLYWLVAFPFGHDFFDPSIRWVCVLMPLKSENRFNLRRIGGNHVSDF